MNGIAALLDRGLEPATLEQFGVEPTTAGVRYPVRSNGAIHDWREKAADPAAAGWKYRWQHADHAGADCPSIVYGLEQLPPDVDALWIAEGEPDMWALAQAGLPAVSLLHGASTVKSGAAELLAQRASRAHIVYDLDDAGRAGAERLAAALTAKGMRVTIVELPSWLGDHGDVDDLLVQFVAARELARIDDAGPATSGAEDAIDARRLQRDQVYLIDVARSRTLAQVLEALASICPLWQGRPFDPEAVGGEAAPRTRRLYRLSELADLKSAAEDAVIGGGLLTRGGKLLIAAPAGAGKTTFIHHLGAALASGRPFLGRYRMDRAYCVLCISAELVDAELASHGQSLLGPFEGTSATENLIFWLETGLRLPRCYPELRQVVRETGAEVVIFDPFMEFFEGESSDKPEHVQKVFAALDQLQHDEALAGTVVVHHMGVAGQRSAGSWKFDGWPSTILELERVPGVPNDRMLVFKKIRAPGFGQPEKMQIRLSDAGYLPITHEEPQRTAGEMVVVVALREAGGQLRRQDLIDHVRNRASVKLRAAAGYVGRAVQGGLIEGTQDGREIIYRLTDAAAS